MSKIIRTALVFIFFALLMPFAVIGYTEAGKLFGYKKVPVDVVGTGSMYPSLFWVKEEGGPDDSADMVVSEYRTTPHMYHYFPGITVNHKLYLHRQIGFLDLVTFKSNQTAVILESESKDTSLGFIKRVLGLPGDTIQIRDGYLYRNGEFLDEPYINTPRSTYGGEFLPDCEILTIPAQHYFVLGDNRKISSDSRGKLGLVKDDEISFTLPYREQEIYHSLWRDTSHDAELAGTPTLDADEFYQLLNAKRQEAGLSPLTPRSRLISSSSYKANEILAGNPNYPLENALAQSGYSNIITSEFSVSGRYTANELLTNLLYFDNTRSQILDPDLDDIGLSDLNKEVNSCPTEVIVGHLGGYLPANYDSETLTSWENLRDNLQNVIPSWEQARTYQDIDQTKLEELLALYYKRLDLAKEIISTIHDSAWLSDDQLARIKLDESDATRANDLAKELNQL
jgi:signal peptidase I